MVAKLHREAARILALPDVRRRFVACLQDHAVFLHQEALDVLNADADDRTKLAASARLYRQAIAETEEALTCVPGHEDLASNLKNFRHNLGLIVGPEDVPDAMAGRRSNTDEGGEHQHSGASRSGS